MKNNDISTTLAGVAGEYFVAAELSRRGFIASISLRNTRGVDILATNEKTSRSVTIQCKTTRDPKAKSWIVSEKCESCFHKNHFYVFVTLQGIFELPKFYVVPSKDVAKVSLAGHKEWISHRKRDGTKRKTNSMRIFQDIEGEYLEKWQLIEKALS